MGFTITHKKGLVMGARTSPSNPDDCHTLVEQRERTRILNEEHKTPIKQVCMDLTMRSDRAPV